MFNFMSVLVLLPLEAITGYLYALSKALIEATPGLDNPQYFADGTLNPDYNPANKPPDILKALTKPFTSQIIKVDKKLINKITEASTDEERDKLLAQKMLKHLFGNDGEDVDASDTLVGILVLLAALAILCASLFVIVYLLKSILKGQVAVWLHKSVNGQVPDIRTCLTWRSGERVHIPMGWLSGYLAMAVGMGLTICVQSSSITTSALTPLVGIGVLKVAHHGHKCPPWQRPSSAPAPPQGAPGGSGQLGTPTVRPNYWAPSPRLGRSSELPPKPPHFTAFDRPGAAVTLPLHCRYIAVAVAVAFPLPGCNEALHVTVTLPLHCRYIAVTM